MLLDTIGYRTTGFELSYHYAKVTINNTNLSKDEQDFDGDIMFYDNYGRKGIQRLTDRMYYNSKTKVHDFFGDEPLFQIVKATVRLINQTVIVVLQDSDAQKKIEIYCVEKRLNNKP